MIHAERFYQVSKNVPSTDWNELVALFSTVSVFMLCDSGFMLVFLDTSVFFSPDYTHPTIFSNVEVAYNSILEKERDNDPLALEVMRSTAEQIQAELDQEPRIELLN